jgi:hypothetical protein
MMVTANSLSSRTRLARGGPVRESLRETSETHAGVVQTVSTLFGQTLSYLRFSVV